MINIIKHGHPEMKRFECKICGCIFEADIGDYEERGYVDEETLKDVFYYVCKCPCCGQFAKSSKNE